MLVKQCTARIMLSNSACECFLLVLKENSAVAISQHSTYCGVMWWPKIPSWCANSVIRVAFSNVAFPDVRWLFCEGWLFWGRGLVTEQYLFLPFRCLAGVLDLHLFLYQVANLPHTLFWQVQEPRPLSSFSSCQRIVWGLVGKPSCIVRVTMLGDLGLEHIDGSCLNRIWQE